MPDLSGASGKKRERASVSETGASCHTLGYNKNTIKIGGWIIKLAKWF